VSVFDAVADPTRRQIVVLLAERERTAGEIAAAFQVSRPAISRHLRVLREAGVVAARVEAQRRIYRLEPAALDEIDDWIAAARAVWAGRLDALDDHLRQGRTG
jgi:DNA-binding transcriptional ArsR family regulator